VRVHTHDNGLHGGVRFGGIKLFAEEGNGIFTYGHWSDEWGVKDETVNIDDCHAALDATTVDDHRLHRTRDWTDGAKIGQACVDWALKVDSRAQDHPLTARAERYHE